MELYAGSLRYDARRAIAKGKTRKSKKEKEVTDNDEEDEKKKDLKPYLRVVYPADLNEKYSREDLETTEENGDGPGQSGENNGTVMYRSEYGGSSTRQNGQETPYGYGDTPTPEEDQESKVVVEMDKTGTGWFTTGPVEQRTPKPKAGIGFGRRITTPSVASESDPPSPRPSEISSINLYTGRRKNLLYIAPDR